MDAAAALHHEDLLLKKYFGPRPPQAVPPPPAETVYHAGTGQYEPLAYHNNGLPKPCRAGKELHSETWDARAWHRAGCIGDPWLCQQCHGCTSLLGRRMLVRRRLHGP